MPVRFNNFQSVESLSARHNRQQVNQTAHQEALAQQLYVSRAAVSKWESGRGCPGIDSLKAIAKFYGVTIDDLLSGEEVLTLAEEDRVQRSRLFRDRIFGLLDLGSALFFVLPLFGQQENGIIRAVSLPMLTGASAYLKAAYFAAVTAMILCGVLTLALRNCSRKSWVTVKTTLSLCFHVLAVLLFIISSQPYCAVLLFLFLGIKAYLLIKRQ